MCERKAGRSLLLRAHQGQTVTRRLCARNGSTEENVSARWPAPQDVDLPNSRGDLLSFEQAPQMRIGAGNNRCAVGEKHSFCWPGQALPERLPKLPFVEAIFPGKNCEAERVKVNQSVSDDKCSAV